MSATGLFGKKLS